MPTTTPDHKKRKDDEFKWRDTTWKNKRQWFIWENVGLQPIMTLNDLELKWIDPRIRGTDIIGAASEITLDRTIDGASTLTIKVLDPMSHIFSRGRYGPQPLTPKQRRDAKKRRYKAAEVDEGWEPMLRPDQIGQWCEVTMRGAKFRLVKVSYSYADDTATLTFEDAIIFMLKRTRGERRASRRKVTRAQFILSQLRDVKSIKPPFICPELMVKQPVDSGAPTPAAKKLSTRTTGGGSGGDAGFSPNARLVGGDVNGQDYPITGQARRNCEIVLAAADKITGDSRARIALCETCNIENHWNNSTTLASDGSTSVGIMEVRTLYVPLHLATDLEYCTKRFLAGPSWTGAEGGKGAVDLAKAHPDWSEGKIAQTIQGSAFPDRYDKTKRQAVDLLRKWGGAGGSPEGTASTYEVSYNKAYQFARGKDENAYVSIMRLAEEVNWKFFPVGEAVYYMSEEQLFNRRIRYTFRPGDNSILDMTWDTDWGKPVSQCTVQVALDRWGAPPGAVVELDGWDVPDGRWLITSVRRNWFEQTAEVTLQQPGKAKLEPAEEKAKRTINVPGGVKVPGSGDVTDPKGFPKVAKAIELAKQFTGSYVWGGGHGPIGAYGVHSGLDCSGSCSTLLHMVDMFPFSTGIVSGSFNTWGLAGEGKAMTVWYNGGHVWIEFRGPFSGEFNTAGHSGVSGPRYKTPSTYPKGGFASRHWPGA